MRILLIHNFYQYWGGEDTYVTSVKKLLEGNGHKVYLYSKDSKNIKTFVDKTKAAIGLFYNPWVAKELTKIVKEFKPDVAHFHNVYPLIDATAYRVCKKHKIPIIQHIHNYRFMCPKGMLFRNGKICELCVGKSFPFYSILFGCYHTSRLASLFFSLAFFVHRITGTFRLIDKFIFPSEFVKNYYLKNLNIPENKAVVIPFFVDFSQNESIKIKKKDYFLYIGRLSEEKGIIQLIEVFKTLPEHKLVVIGDGPLRKKVESYKKYKNITLMGFLPRKRIGKYIQTAKAIIISSIWYEVFPFVLLEVIAQNIPILVPDNENFKLIFKYIKNSNIINYYKFRDFDDLKNKIISFDQNARSLEKLKIINFYNPEIHYRILLREYKKMLRNA